jgi:hypothetical protein
MMWMLRTLFSCEDGNDLEVLILKYAMLDLAAV